MTVGAAAESRYRSAVLDHDLREELVRLGAHEGKLLIAVSGGRDSMVLLNLVSRAMPALSLNCVVAHVNHGLRGGESDADEAHAQRSAEAMGIRFYSRRVAPEAERVGVSSRARPTLEEAARNLRRAALVEIAEETQSEMIVTAHHAGDQAETLLLRLLRGTGPDGLAGMSSISADGRWLRPLLRVLPDAIAAWAIENKIQWREDESNQDRRFARNRLRLDWIPQLSSTFNPQLLRTLGDLAEARSRDLEWIEHLVDEAIEERVEFGPMGCRFTIDGWDNVPEALARRIVRRVLVETGLARDVTRTHLARVLAFLRAGRKVGRDKELQLPAGYTIRRDGDAFEMRRQLP